ncbi:CASH domain-dontaining protein, partial [Candidatus Methanophagaceae archaeon]
VSMNGTWTNDSALTYMNVSVGSGGWANITVWAWNASGTGTLSAGYVSDEVQAPEANANLSIWDDTDPEGGSQTKYANNKVCFYANYTNKTSGGSINGTGVYCNISFNVTPSGPFDMTFNSSSLLYEYNRTFSSAGAYEWNVTCNGSVQGYDVLNATDTVTISTTNNPPAITLNKPDNGSTIPNNWTILNATVTDADNDNTTVYFYANNNSNGLNASEGLVYIGENVANGTTLTYNLTVLPIKPSEDGLVLLMHFDNRSRYGENSTHTYDFSGNGNNGSCSGINCPIWNATDGKFAGAFEFDGTDDINVGDVMPAGAYTKVAWVKRGDGAYSNNIISGNTNHAFWAPTPSFKLSAGHNGGYNIVEDSDPLDVGKWYHAAVTFDPESDFGPMVLYKNGVEVANATGVPTQGDSSITYIGRFATGNNWNGTIDEAAIYNRALSSAEIKAHYALGDGKYYWKVNATDGVLSNESDVWEFNVADQTAPSIQLNYPDDKANLSSSTVNFNWTATDNIDDVLLCNLTIDGVVNQSDIDSTSGQPTNYSVSGISTGVHNWSVTCRDDAPNVNTSETRTFGVNNSAPNVALNSPPNGSSTPNSWAILNATVTDADDDPMTVYFYANSNSNGLNASEGLVYVGENVANGTTLTYNLTALPIKPSEANLSLLMHFDNRSEYGENSTHVYDFSRNGNNGTVNGNPIYNISGGKFAGAFEFDGTEDYVDCGNDPVLPENTPFTVSAWVKLNSLDQGEWKVVTNKLGTGNYVTLTIFLSPANEFSFTTANGTWSPLSDLKTGAVNANQWYHVVSTWNGTTKCIYLDGDLSNSTNPASSYEPGAGTGNFSIGARVSGLYCLNGTIDEVAIYNRSLSADEILNHYRLGDGKYYWKVNASDGVLSNESDVWQFTVGVPATLTCTCGDICVNGTGWWRNNGTFNASSTRIQHAIDNATAGDSIYVYNGSYTENVDVNKQLTLTGEGTDVVNVTNSTADSQVFNVSANYVNISGFNVTGATGNMKAGIYIGNGVDRCNISGNTVSDNYIGIYLNSSSSDNLFANNTISDNTWD